VRRLRWKRAQNGAPCRRVRDGSIEFKSFIDRGGKTWGAIVKCIFHAVADTHFTGSRAAFHGDAGHRFTLIADSVLA
jgi:hypothetical protein